MFHSLIYSSATKSIERGRASLTAAAAKNPLLAAAVGPLEAELSADR